MTSNYPTPSPSSHASSLLRAALQTQIPGPSNQVSNAPGSRNNINASPTTTTASTRQAPVYNLFWLDFGVSVSSSTIGSSSGVESGPERVRSLVQNLQPPSMTTSHASSTPSSRLLAVRHSLKKPPGLKEIPAVLVADCTGPVRAGLKWLERHGYY
ncbi:hypothetical protein B0H14DRAFT_2643494 [Mycena olivaceomarginata]|nr:hypothetical protein B0H14DRAFT_2643494 [Mycena olivaceomarginata]